MGLPACCLSKVTPGRSIQGKWRNRCHDWRWRKRCACVEGRAYRDSHGRQGNRCCPRSRVPRGARRRFFLDCRGCTSRRRIYDNLQKAMTYVFAIHLPIAGLSLLPVLFGLPLVLMPLHIVFLELVIDPACSTAFESEPAHPQIMNRPQRNPKSRLFDRRMITSARFQGLLLFAMTLGAFLISLYRGQGEVDARAISFTTLVLGNIALIWANRSRTRTIPEMLRSRNIPLWAVTVSALALLAVVLYVPAIRDLFQFSTLHLNDIAVCAALALASITGIEAAKLIRRYI